MSAESSPVFIGGLDRSGKTPLRRILETSTEIAFSRRTYLWTHFYGRYGDLAEPVRRARCFDELRRYRRIAELGVDLAVVERELEAGAPTYARLFGLVGAQAAAAAGRPRWGEQEGGIEDRLEAVLDAFPEARVVHMIRDPRDRHLAVADGRRRAGLLGIAVSRWRVNARRAMANARRHPERYLVVRYEDLAHAPRETAERVGRFIGEPPGAPLGDTAEEWAGASGGDDDPRAIGRFAEAMPDGELAFAESRLADEMAAFDYAPLRRHLSIRQRLWYGGVTWPLNSISPLAARAGRLRRGGLEVAKVRLDEAPA